ncbi:regulator of chromosome condensation [Tribolium castaneum]|uniref:Regulator of chromosome condensation-like Protein n=1 Tax=Tribolium castaneum TaxID=7070 RepID=A0A139WK14_TRICA|nr:PREDICTED: regulator of chromosome condensation [Tribolium castaneum]KYB28388.1 Regulator of chromosome condensation-like Protein [Tribolium castaneum]|eukprot:XP_008191372.1 PREDICTED: regulator of chromosome condensation [Tribolium castaneum]
MAGKRRRPSTTEAGATKPKRAKFTLDSVKLPETTREGVLLVTGAGDCGQLGLGPDVLEKSRPALVQTSDEIVDICAGGMHTVCLTKEGKILSFGCNDEGALGRITEGKEDAESTPGEVELPGKVIQITAGDSHSAALLDDGRVFAWGTFRDSHGNMGLTLRGNEKLPYEIIQEVHVIKIASGADHIVFLTNHGEVYTCGCPEQGQLGRTSERGSSRNARSNMGKGQIAKLLQPTIISLKPSLKLHFDNIWAGTYCTFAKVAGKSDIYVFGLNNYNQLGLKSLAPQYLPILSKEFSKYNWSMISSAEHHTIALTENGKTYAIGRKDYGRLGLGKDCEDASELTEIPALKDKTVVYVACGSSTSFAVTDKGELYGWGMGTNGQLGNGEEEDCFEPTYVKSKQLTDRPVFKVSAGGQHAVILATNSNNNKGDS